MDAKGLLIYLLTLFFVGGAVFVTINLTRPLLSAFIPFSWTAFVLAVLTSVGAGITYLYIRNWN